jgi:hypothetical protein
VRHPSASRYVASWECACVCVCVCVRALCQERRPHVLNLFCQKKKSHFRTLFCQRKKNQNARSRGSTHDGADPHARARALPLSPDACRSSPDGFGTASEVFLRKERRERRVANFELGAGGVIVIHFRTCLGPPPKPKSAFVVTGPARPVLRAPEDCAERRVCLPPPRKAAPEASEVAEIANMVAGWGIGIGVRRSEELPLPTQPSPLLGLFSTSRPSPICGPCNWGVDTCA